MNQAKTSPVQIIFLFTTIEHPKTQSKLVKILEHIDIDGMIHDTGISKETIVKAFSRITTPAFIQSSEKIIVSLQEGMKKRSVNEACKSLLSAQKTLLLGKDTEAEYFAVRSIAKLIYARRSFFESRKGIRYLAAALNFTEPPTHQDTERLLRQLDEERIQFKGYLYNLD